MIVVVRKAPKHKCINLETHRSFLSTRYMQRQPTIMPNYGRKSPKLGVPKTSLSRVLLYDNITQQQMLDVKLAHIKIEKQRAEYLLNMHKRSFSLSLENRRKKQRTYRNTENKKVRFPGVDLVAKPKSKALIDTTQKKALTAPNTPQMIRRISTFSLSSVKLPAIGNHKKQILLKLKTPSGRRKVYHSYDDSGIFVDIVPVEAFYKSISEEPRFQNLAMSLQIDDTDAEGFVILSPSYEKHYPKIPEFLLDDQTDHQN